MYLGVMITDQDVFNDTAEDEDLAVQDTGLVSTGMMDTAPERESYIKEENAGREAR